MSVLCPLCRKEVSPGDVNDGADVAYCRSCNHAAKLSAIAAEVSDKRDALRRKLTGESPGNTPVAGPTDETIPAPDLANPPPGCWYRDDGMEARVGATCRSVGGAAFMIFFTLFWNGVVSIFVVVNIASTLHHMGITPPAWFPTPSSNPSGMTLGTTVFMWLFLTPFIAIGLATAAIALTSLFGRLEVRVRETRGTVFVGVGPIGWRRRFDTLGVQSISIGQTTWTQNNQSKPVIVIHGDETLRFGSMLSERN